jgi:integrase
MVILPIAHPERTQNTASLKDNPETIAHRGTDLPVFDLHLPTEWRGWHAARRRLGSNLYRLGVSATVIERILRHANVSTTATYYIKIAAVDVHRGRRSWKNASPKRE